MAYTSPPVEYDHELIIGDTYNPGVAEAFDSAGDPYDLTGATGTVSLRREPGAAVALSPTFALVGAGTLGTFQWSSPHTDTAALAPGEYHYAVRVTFGDGTRRTVYEGKITARKTAVT